MLGSILKAGIAETSEGGSEIQKLNIYVYLCVCERDTV